MAMKKPIVGIIMGSDSDLAIMEKAAEVLQEMGVPYEMDISSAHRLPDKTAEYAKSARDRGIEVVIAGAGMAAHLAGVIAAHTTLPVIGVPLKSGALNGAYAHSGCDRCHRWRKECRLSCLLYPLDQVSRVCEEAGCLQGPDEEGPRKEVSQA